MSDSREEATGRYILGLVDQKPTNPTSIAMHSEERERGTAAVAVSWYFLASDERPASLNGLYIA